VEDETSIPVTNLSKTINGIGLTSINNKPLYYHSIGKAGRDPIIFVHGLGGTSECWHPLISTLSLERSHSLHLFDLEGHGLSPTSPQSVLSISSLAEDVKGLYQVAGISTGATIIAHSMGCLVALAFAIANPELVKRLILLGPPPSPLPEAAVQGSHARAATARTKGMVAVVDAVVTAGTSQRTKDTNPIAISAVRLALMGQDPEGYAKACSALAGVTSAIDTGKLSVETLIVTGNEDKVSPPSVCQKYATSMKAKEPIVLKNVGHWHFFEDINGVSEAIKSFLPVQNGVQNGS
jgi:pimeloyl-ACP methyl ester carboxylesterase